MRIRKRQPIFSSSESISSLHLSDLNQFSRSPVMVQLSDGTHAHTELKPCSSSASLIVSAGSSLDLHQPSDQTLPLIGKLNNGYDYPSTIEQCRVHKQHSKQDPLDEKVRGEEEESGHIKSNYISKGDILLDSQLLPSSTTFVQESQSDAPPPQPQPQSTPQPDPIQTLECYETPIRSLDELASSFYDKIKSKTAELREAASSYKARPQKVEAEWTELQQLMALEFERMVEQSQLEKVAGVELATSKDNFRRQHLKNLRNFIQRHKAAEAKAAEDAKLAEVARIAKEAEDARIAKEAEAAKAKELALANSSDPAIQYLKKRVDQIKEEQERQKIATENAQNLLQQILQRLPPPGPSGT